MPKRSGGDRQMCPFHSFIPVALVAGAGVISVSPNSTLSTRSSVEADAWAHFRVRSFAVRLHPPASSVTNPQAIGYVGGVQDTPPSTLSQIMELLPSTVISQETTVPTEWVRPSKADLAGAFPWYKTQNGAADLTETAPGQMVYAGTSTDTVFIEVRGVFEFKTAVSTGNTPLEARLALECRLAREATARARARVQLLSILSAGDGGKMSSGLLAGALGLNDPGRVGQPSTPPGY